MRRSELGIPSSLVWTEPYRQTLGSVPHSRCPRRQAGGRAVDRENALRPVRADPGPYRGRAVLGPVGGMSGAPRKTSHPIV